MGNKKEKSIPGDDGRVYADMSVLDDIAPKFSIRPRKKKKTKLDDQGFPHEEETLDLTKEEKKAIVRGVIRAHLVYALLGILLLAIVFFILIKVWLN